MKIHNEQLSLHLGNTLLGEVCGETVVDLRAGGVIIEKGQRINKATLRRVAEMYPHISLTPGAFARAVEKAVLDYEDQMKAEDQEAWWKERYCKEQLEEERFRKKWDSTHDKSLGLSTRAINKLFSFKILATREAIQNALESGHLEKQRGLGIITENELRRVAGLPEKELPNQPWKFDPWTGEPIPPEQQRKRTRPKRKA